MKTHNKRNDTLQPRVDGKSQQQNEEERPLGALVSTLGTDGVPGRQRSLHHGYDCFGHSHTSAERLAFLVDERMHFSADSRQGAGHKFRIGTYGSTLGLGHAI